MKKLIKLFFLVIFSLFVNDYSFAEYIDKNSAVISIMNKAAGKTKIITASVDKNTKIEKLEIIIRTCKATDPYSAENYLAFAEIYKSGSQIFSGWLNRNEPGKNPVQDSDYDVWLIGCD